MVKIASEQGFHHLLRLSSSLAVRSLPQQQTGATSTVVAAANYCFIDIVSLVKRPPLLVKLLIRAHGALQLMPGQHYSTVIATNFSVARRIPLSTPALPTTYRRAFSTLQRAS